MIYELINLKSLATKPADLIYPSQLEPRVSNHVGHDRNPPSNFDALWFPQTHLTLRNTPPEPGFPITRHDNTALSTTPATPPLANTGSDQSHLSNSQADNDLSSSLSLLIGHPEMGESESMLQPESPQKTPPDIWLTATSMNEFVQSRTLRLRKLTVLARLGGWLEYFSNIREMVKEMQGSDG